MKKIYLCLWLLASSAMLYAQEAFQYQMPPQAMADLADAPSTPQVSFDNRRDMMLLLEFPKSPVLQSWHNRSCVLAACVSTLKAMA